jgi:hypothetical protein
MTKLGDNKSGAGMIPALASFKHHTTVEVPVRLTNLAFGLSLAAGPVFAAQLPDGGVTAADIVHVLQPAGYSAEALKDAKGEPFIVSASGGVKWGIAFYDCDLPARERCRSIQFSAMWDGKNVPVSLDKIAEWNRKKRFTKAYLSSRGDTVVQMDLPLAKGATSELIQENIDIWTYMVGSFPAFIRTIASSSRE